MPLHAANTVEYLPTSALAAELPDRLILETQTVIRYWIDHLSSEPAFYKLLNRDKFQHEVEESIVAINYIIQFLEKQPVCQKPSPPHADVSSTLAQRDEEAVTSAPAPTSTTARPPCPLPSDSESESRSDSSRAAPRPEGPANDMCSSCDSSPSALPSTSLLSVYDLCAGKGFMSLLLAYLVPRYATLSAWIGNIVMVDKSGAKRSPINVDHIHVANADPASVPISFVQADLHNPCFARVVGIGAGTRGLFVGLHLCERLSSRAVELFTALDPAILALVLSPCCVPLTKRNNNGHVKLNGHEITTAAMMDAEDPYQSWCDWLLLAVNESDKFLTQASLKGGTLRKNTYIIACRESDRWQWDATVQACKTASKHPELEGLCRTYFYKKKCLYGSKCKFQHLGGSYLHGSHI